MTTFKIHCPNCNQKLEADDSMEGMEAACPKCQQTIKIARPQLRLATDSEGESKKKFLIPIICVVAGVLVSSLIFSVILLSFNNKTSTDNHKDASSITKSATEKNSISPYELLLKYTEFGDVDKLKDLLKHNNIDVDRPKGKSGQTAFYYACSLGFLDVAELLLSKGANPRTKNTGGYTPLTVAAACGKLEIVKFLLKNGIKINELDGKGCSALMRACGDEVEQLEMVKFLLKNGAKIDLEYNNTSILNNPVRKNYVQTTELLLKNGADPNAVNRGNTSLLRLACILENYDIIRLLIRYGANADISYYLNKNSVIYKIAYEEMSKKIKK